jgi:hypothetical protein
MNGMKKSKKIQRLALFLILTLALSMFSTFPGLTNAQESIGSSNAEWTPSADSAAVNNSEGDLSLNELAVKVLSEADTPEVIDAATITEKQHVNRLWAQETDMNTIIFQNTDGTKSMYYYGVPVKYTDPDGVIRDKSNKVVENQDKAAYPEYSYQNKANDIVTLFPKILSREDGIVLENAGTKIELIPYNYTDAENDETTAVESSARKEECVHNDGESADAVIYDNVFGGGTKLQYTPTFMGFKEDLILEQNTGINRFQFILKSGELQAVLENGCIYLIDPLTGETEATVSPIYVYDSYKGIKSYENTHDTWNNEIILKELDSDGNYLVAITVDEEFLNDPDTVYPVYVDPTLTFDENTDINDAIIYSGSPSVAHGSNYYNYIGYYNTTYGIGRLLVKFPGMIGDNTYSSLSASQISSVTYYAYTDGTNAETSIRPYIYTGSAWTESTVTCNMVSWNGTVTLTDMPAVTVPNSAGNIAFDITAAAKAWKAGTYSASSGLMLKNSNEYSSSYYKIFTSTEYGSYYGTHMPYTEVDYFNLPSQVCISETSRTVNVNDSFYLTASVLPNDAPQGITWSSSNSSIATVSSGGLVHANSNGNVTITARSSLYSPVYATCTVTVNKLKIYQTEKTLRDDKYMNEAEDLQNFDKTESELTAMNYITEQDFIDKDADIYRYAWEFMCTTLFATEPLETVVLDMIDHFMTGTGYDYSNSTLTQKVYEHASTQTYIDDVKEEIDELLDEYNGNISYLQYYVLTRDDNPLVQHMTTPIIIYEPVYNTPADIITGLTICIDSLWGNMIEVKSYTLNGSSYSGTLHFTLYDHFGLNAADIETYGDLTGFRYWYILQHLDTFNGQYKSFVDIMEFDVPFSGTID